MKIKERKRLSATLAGVEEGDTCPVRLMGVLNVSPESFYQGSVYTSPKELGATAQAMVSAGAEFIDIGAMSTAPYQQTTISVEEERDRLAEAIAVVSRAVTVPLSADTQRSVPAQAAIAAGAKIINDVSGLKQDPEMAALVAEAGAGLILMASENAPQPGSPLKRIRAALRASLAIARRAGISEERIVIDPGIGFFRQTGIPWYEWDIQVIRELGQLRCLQRPILVGVSRKSFIGKILQQENPQDRLIGSLAVAVIAVYNGAHIIRTHDVGPTREAVRLAERFRFARSF
jgi:dihydropteroate synthase